MRILLVDDDELLMEALATELIANHYAVDVATNGEMGWEFIHLFNYNLVVLDLKLPDIDGITLCQKLRAQDYKMPILLLTASDDQQDKIRGLDAGADDYVVKPFDFQELTARIRALLRRDSQNILPILCWNDLSLDPKTCEVKYQEQILSLTPKEYALLELFLRYPKQVFSPGAIIESLWAGEDPPGEESVRTHIKGLRQKFQAVGMAKDTVQTVYGIGYRLKSIQEKHDAPRKKKAQTRASVVQHSQASSPLGGLKELAFAPDSDAGSDHFPNSNNPSGAARRKSATSARIAQAWAEKFKAVTHDRVAILDNFATAVFDNQGSDESHEQARTTAHKLAGSLGGFGFPEGSKIAKKIEQLLMNQSLSQKDREQIRSLVNNLQNDLQHQPFQESEKTQLTHNLLILTIDDNIQFTQQLAQAAPDWGVRIAIAKTAAEARKLLKQEHPEAILLKIYFPEAKGLSLLEELRHLKPALPIAVIMEGGTFENRLSIVNQGANLVLPEPVSCQNALASVVELVQNSGWGAKIMIVDDDPQVLRTLEIALQPWGFQLITLDDPKRCWDLLLTTNPDLLVLDLEMPEYNGIELCQVLRSDRRWQKLPVLFLSAHKDQQSQTQAFAIGADDYICKPVKGAELAHRILNRLKRSKALNS
ncbi:MAG: response regulator [Xenococcus sp. MO_188.B8]|nr:response regulator [Xenococcus sp. MO_188.B8]